MLEGCLETPRELKRFVNEVRLYAARSQATAGTDALKASEPAVVALAALRVLDGWARERGHLRGERPLHQTVTEGATSLEGSAFWDRFVARERTEDSAPWVSDLSAFDTAEKALKTHNENAITDPVWKLTERDRAAFSVWSEGVRV